MKNTLSFYEVTKRMEESQARRRTRDLRLKERKPIAARIRRLIRVCFGI